MSFNVETIEYIAQQKAQADANIIQYFVMDWQGFVLLEAY